MQDRGEYHSPLGTIFLTADEEGLTGLWFEEQKQDAGQSVPERGGRERPVFFDAKRWLDLYFSGREPDFTVPVHQTGTAFQKEVWEIVSRIPYGAVTTYGDIARELAARRGIPRISAQAICGAVGHNKIPIFVPCHRVIGSDGSLIGYGGGIERKAALLELEHAFGKEMRHERTVCRGTELKSDNKDRGAVDAGHGRHKRDRL